MRSRRFYAISALRTFLFFFAIEIILVLVFFGFISNPAETTDLDRNLESAAIDALHDNPERYYGQQVKTQGLIQDVERRTPDTVNHSVWIILGGCRANDTPIRVAVNKSTHSIERGAVIRIDGKGIPDPFESGHLALIAENTFNVPVARFIPEEAAITILIRAITIAGFLALVGAFWEWTTPPECYPPIGKKLEKDSKKGSEKLAYNSKSFDTNQKQTAK